MLAVAAAGISMYVCEKENQELHIKQGKLQVKTQTLVILIMFFLLKDQDLEVIGRESLVILSA